MYKMKREKLYDIRTPIFYVLPTCFCFLLSLSLSLFSIPSFFLFFLFIKCSTRGSSVWLTECYILLSVLLLILYFFVFIFPYTIVWNMKSLKMMFANVSSQWWYLTQYANGLSQEAAYAKRPSEINSEEGRNRHSEKKTNKRTHRANLTRLMLDL